MWYRLYRITTLFLISVCATMFVSVNSGGPISPAGAGAVVVTSSESSTNSLAIFAGKLQPDLALRLATMSDDDTISVEIAVAGGISAKDLNDLLDSTCSTLAERRRVGVLLLKERAIQTQKHLLAELHQLQLDGLVRNFESHWLTNTISVDLAAASVRSIVVLRDVTEVFQYPKIIQMVPDLSEPAAKWESTTEGGVEENLKCIGADSAWRMGYTGAGRVVCHFDCTGVEGGHPALKANWKGRDGRPSAAWLGGFALDGYPAAAGYSELDAHGTHVVGIMVGHDDKTGDTVGVAPGADWIGSTGPAWEWAADPDGNPNTTDDVPDVINISFMTGGSCWDVYWDRIDMTEALGIVNIISAGNSGPAPYSVVGPGNRAVDSLTNFAVGSIDHRSGTIYRSSGRGPSICDSVSIKPNVAAPGAYIRSSVPGGLYAIHGGTSMAAPHVSGAVAILRQFAPNASVRQIKEALLAGCTPAGGEMPNNDYGWGIINIPASISYLTSLSQPDVRVVSFDYSPIDIKDTLRTQLRLNNRGYPIDSVYVSFAGQQNGITVLTDSVYYGTLNMNQESAGDKMIEIILADTMYAGAKLSIQYTIHGANGYQRTGNLVIQAGIPGSSSYFTHTTGSVEFTVSNFGRYNYFRCGELSQDWLYDGALMIGIDTEHVSDGFRNMSVQPDDDFWWDITDNFYIRTPGPVADQETECRYDDGRAEHRIGIQVRQKSYSWDIAPDTGFVILEYTLQNIHRHSIDGIYAGLALDWNFTYGNYDNQCEGDFSRQEGLGFIFKHTSELDSSWFRGVAVLNPEGVASYRVIGQPNDGRIRGPGLSDSSKFAALSGGLVDTNRTGGDHETLMHVISTGPFTLAPGASDTAYFALLASNSLIDLRVAALRAKRKAQSMTEVYNPLERFVLSQNCPNPFNSVTRISFTLPHAANVKLVVFNVLGQQVRTLVCGRYDAGIHEVEWDGTDGYGHLVSSGVYLYRLKAEGVANTKKMILLK